MARRRETLLALVALAAVGAAVFGAQVARGGFYWDDWQNAANVHFAGGFFDALDQATGRPVFGYRPVLTVLLVVKHSIFGTTEPVQIGFAVAFGVLTAWALWLLMRELRATRVEAGAASALLLLFPWADSTRIWPTASMDTLAVALYLLGALLAVRGLRSGRLALAAGSLALYLAAIWTYEVASVPVLASVLLYRLVAPPRRALRRFGLDVACVALGIAVNLSGTTRHPRTLGDTVDHARQIAGQLVTLAGRAVVPVGSMPWWVGALLLVAGAAALVLRRSRRYALPVALGAVWVAAGYVLYAPAEAYYLPLSPGTVTRMNSFGAAGFAVLVVGLVSLLLRRAVLVAGACVLIGAGYVVKVAHDERDWQRSARVQAHVLGSIRNALPERPRHALRIYTFNAPSFVAPEIPAFSLPFDLRSAIALQYGDRSLAAFPIRGLDVIRCDPDRLYPVGGTYSPLHGALYGNAVFVDVRSDRAIPIGSRAACLTWRARLGAARA